VATVGEVLREATARLRVSGSPTPVLDAEVLIAHVLHIDRTGVLAHPEAPLGDGQVDAIHAAIGRRETGEPVAYIRAFKEFHGLAIAVDPRVLIPRPETELLVDLAVSRVAARLSGAPRPAGTPPLRLADVGTGSGAVAVALAVAFRRRGFLPHVDVLASDVSEEALAVALENAVSHGVADRIRFRLADLLPDNERPFDVLVANPPYVPSGELATLPVAASFEPQLALDGGLDGLVVIRALLGLLPSVLAAGGTALIEFGAEQAESLRVAVEATLPGWAMQVHADLAGLPRVAELDAGGAP